jgi:hypothetical protein
MCIRDRCGGKMEESHRECAIVCYGCFLARSIPNPRRYMHREKYDQLPITLNHPVRNAIKKPKTGLSFLDQERKFLWLLCRNRREALDLCDREQRQGKDESEYWHPKCIN